MDVPNFAAKFELREGGRARAAGEQECSGLNPLIAAENTHRRTMNKQVSKSGRRSFGNNWAAKMAEGEKCPPLLVKRQ